MAFKKYSYGSQKQKVKTLLRRRLSLKAKIRYHKEKAKELEKIKLPEVEKQIDNLLKRIEGKK